MMEKNEIGITGMERSNNHQANAREVVSYAVISIASILQLNIKIE